MAGRRNFMLGLIAASIVAASAHPELTSAKAATPSVADDVAAIGDQSAIRSILAAYNDALIGSKAAAVLPLYTHDGIFMLPYSGSAVWKNEVRKAYYAVFEELSVGPETC